jgi:hypothetical protein
MVLTFKLKQEIKHFKQNYSVAIIKYIFEIIMMYVSRSCTVLRSFIVSDIAKA